MRDDAKQVNNKQAGHIENETTTEPVQSLESSICSFEAFEYHPDDDAYHVRFDATSVAPSIAVVGAVATVADCDPLDIEPLYSTIGPDGLDTLCGRGTPVGGEVTASFRLDGYEVTVTSRSSIVVRPRHDEADVSTED